jgi:hypothetical protein
MSEGYQQASRNAKCKIKNAKVKTGEQAFRPPILHF